MSFWIFARKNILNIMNVLRFKRFSERQLLRQSIKSGDVLVRMTNK